jgi:hypothetical protein
MPVSAANPSPFSHPLPCMVEQANPSPLTRNYAGGLRSSEGVFGCRKRAARTVDFRTQDADENFALRYVSLQCNPVSCSVTAPGNTPIAPCGTASFCFPGALQNKFENSGNKRRTNFFRPAPNKALLMGWSAANHSGGAV